MCQYPLRSFCGEQPERGCPVIPNTPSLGSILESFFSYYLKLQRGLRPNSITSYADAMRLFLQFAAATSKKKITHLGLDDLQADAVSQFLTSLEESQKRGPISQPTIGGPPHLLRICWATISGAARSSSESRRYSEEACSASGNCFS